MAEKRIEPQEVTIKLGQNALAAVLTNNKPREAPDETQVKPGWYLEPSHPNEPFYDFVHVAIGYDGMRNTDFFDLSLRSRGSGYSQARIIHIPAGPVDLELMLGLPYNVERQKNLMSIVPVQIVRISRLELTAKVYSPNR